MRVTSISRRGAKSPGAPAGLNNPEPAQETPRLISRENITGKPRRPNRAGQLAFMRAAVAAMEDGTD
jgi:hypothetical protein